MKYILVTEITLTRGTDLCYWTTLLINQPGGYGKKVDDIAVPMP